MASRGPFAITAYLAGHSTYGAFSLLIQAGGRNLFYTGDIRGHGRRASAFERLLAEPARSPQLVVSLRDPVRRMDISD